MSTEPQKLEIPAEFSTESAIALARVFALQAAIPAALKHYFHLNVIDRDSFEALAAIGLDPNSEAIRRAHEERGLSAAQWRALEVGLRFHASAWDELESEVQSQTSASDESRWGQLAPPLHPELKKVLRVMNVSEDTFLGTTTYYLRAVRTMRAIENDPEIAATRFLEKFGITE